MSKFAAFVVLSVLMLLEAGCASDKAEIRKASFDYGRETRGYAVYTPPDYTPAKRYPTVLFLHGLFESGDDGKACTKVGLGPAVKQHPERFNCIVVFAQTSKSWNDDDQLPLAMATLDDAQRHFSIDPARVVVTGLSTGGGGTWKLGAQYPGRFAALLPLCAYSDQADVPRLTSYPIWAIHNRFDPFVGVWNTNSMCEKINAAGGHAKATVYGNFGHNCWDRAYGDDDVIAWMQNQVIGGGAKFTQR